VKSFPVRTKQIFPGITDEQFSAWQTSKKRLDFISKITNSGMSDGNGIDIDGVKYGGIRNWGSLEIAEQWKDLVETEAKRLGIPFEVTIMKE
jgi:hypothetical protein